MPRKLIIDSFSFFQEYDMLEFRLKLLWDYVDYFVIVEADKTYTGVSKPLNYLTQRERFHPYQDKIIYHPVEIKNSYDGVPPEDYDPTHACWGIENEQRRAILDACKIFTDKGILLLSDLDEIPSRDVMMMIETGEITGDVPIVCRQDFFYFNLKNLRKENWHGTIISNLAHARLVGVQTLRDTRNALPFIFPGGWHLSYMDSVKAIQYKIESFAHQELNKPEFTDFSHITKCIESGSDLYKRGTESTPVGEDFFPDYFVKFAKPYGWI